MKKLIRVIRVLGLLQLSTIICSSLYAINFSCETIENENEEKIQVFGNMNKNTEVSLLILKISKKDYELVEKFKGSIKGAHFSNTGNSIGILDIDFELNDNSFRISALPGYLVGKPEHFGSIILDGDEENQRQISCVIEVSNTTTTTK